MKVIVIKKENTEEAAKKLQDVFNKLNILSIFFDLDDCDSVKENCDIIVALGGDGTIIRASQYAIKNNIPIIGINAGTLGFLSCANIDDDFLEIFNNIINKKFYIDKRSTFNVKVYRDNKLLVDKNFINEVELSAKVRSHVGKFHLYIDNEDNMINDFSSDGLLISTPTGASGYAFSAGAPIISPSSKDILILPIYPHAFNQRPFIIDDEKKIIVTIDKNQSQVLLDGKLIIEVSKDDKIIVQKGEDFLKLICFDKNSFYANFRQKINTL